MSIAEHTEPVQVLITCNKRVWIKRLTRNSANWVDVKIVWSQRSGAALCKTFPGCGMRRWSRTHKLESSTKSHSNLNTMNMYRICHHINIMTHVVCLLLSSRQSDGLSRSSDSSLFKSSLFAFKFLLGFSTFSGFLLRRFADIVQDADVAKLRDRFEFRALQTATLSRSLFFRQSHACHVLFLIPEKVWKCPLHIFANTIYCSSNIRRKLLQIISMTLNGNWEFTVVFRQFLSRNVRADAKDLSLILKMIITPTSLLDDPALNKTFETLVLIGKISISF